MLAAIFLKTGLLPSTVRDLPVGEKMFLFAAMRAEQEAQQKARA